MIQRRSENKNFEEKSHIITSLITNPEPRYTTTENKQSFPAHLLKLQHLLKVNILSVSFFGLRFHLHLGNISIPLDEHLGQGGYLNAG